MSGAAVLDAETSAAFALPIVSHCPVDISGRERRRIGDLAGRIAEQERNISAVPPLDPDLGIGQLAAPSLLIEDHSAIQLVHERGADATLSYRMLLLAGDGDMIAIYGRRDRRFELYCRETLGLGAVDILAPKLASPDQSLSIACVDDDSVLETAATKARAAGGLNIVPYMASGGVWRLAAEIAARAGVPVHVAGPPPRLTRAVNDKLWFAYRAAQLLGRGSVPRNEAVYGMAAMVGHLRRLARDFDTVALKLSQSAASLGNLVLDSRNFADLAPSEASGYLASLMRERGWNEGFPIQVTAWEAPLLGSPSAQLWIPLPEDGAPVVEGIFDQLVSGRGARFMGARPSILPADCQHRIADEAARLGLLFQTLGYFGRCSFDAVVVDHPQAAYELHWVECNGRWGGVSIPMTLANRLAGDWAAEAILITGRRYREMRVKTTGEFLDRFDHMLLKPDRMPHGIALLSPGRIATGGIDLLIVGGDVEDAQSRASDAFAALGD